MYGERKLITKENIKYIMKVSIVYAVGFGIMLFKGIIL